VGVLDKSQNYKVLLKKSSENREIAGIAKDKEYFNVSISRFYYSMFQEITYFILVHEPEFLKKYIAAENKKKENDVEKRQNDSHKETGAKFMELVRAKTSIKLTPNERYQLAQFTKLRTVRNQADYQTIYYEKENFYSEFYEHYNKFNLVMKKLLNGYTS